MRATLTVFASLTFLTGVLYPATVTALAALLFPHAARGSIVEQDGKRVGSDLIGQSFSEPGWFWGRLSATAPVPYTAFDAAALTGSTGSNYGPLHPELRRAVEARIAALHEAERAVGARDDRPVPIDLCTASASGLDPHISRAAAEYQIERVARARGLGEERVRALVAQHTQPRQLGCLGEEVVNVLRLNLALAAVR